MPATTPLRNLFEDLNIFCTFKVSLLQRSIAPVLFCTILCSSASLHLHIIKCKRLPRGETAKPFPAGQQHMYKEKNKERNYKERERQWRGACKHSGGLWHANHQDTQECT